MKEEQTAGCLFPRASVFVFNHVVHKWKAAGQSRVLSNGLPLCVKSQRSSTRLFAMNQELINRSNCSFETRPEPFDA